MGRGLGPENATAKQRACYEMRRTGSTWDEIGAALAMSPQTARQHVNGALRHGLPALPKRKYNFRDVVPDPEAAKRVGIGEIVPTGKFDLKVFMDIAAAAGLPPKAAMAFGQRIQTNQGHVEVEFKKLSAKERIDDALERADFIASRIDPVSVIGMNAKDLALAWKILVDGAQLLGGKPTQIVDFNMRRELTVLMPQFMAEARRRGITVEGEIAGEIEFKVEQPPEEKVV